MPFCPGNLDPLHWQRKKKKKSLSLSSVVPRLGNQDCACSCCAILHGGLPRAHRVCFFAELEKELSRRPKKVCIVKVVGTRNLWKNIVVLCVNS